MSEKTDSFPSPEDVLSTNVEDMRERIATALKRGHTKMLITADMAAAMPLLAAELATKGWTYTVSQFAGSNVLWDLHLTPLQR